MKSGAADDPFAEDEDPDPEPSPTEETAPEPGDDGPTGRMAAIMAALEAQEDGEAAKRVQAWDKDLAAILVGLEEAGELDELGRKLSRQLEREPLEEYGRSEVVKLAVRWAFEEADEDLIEDLREAKAERVRRET